MLRQRPPMLLVLVAVAFAMTVAEACGDGSNSTATTPDGGGLSGSSTDSVCPTAAPAEADACLLPEGTTCSFGACGFPIARCTSGVWRFGGSPAPVPPCPTEFPVEESACPACWPAGMSCTYGSTDCTAPDASANTTVASCESGRWTVRSFPCADAGADVQGDADADAD